MRPCPRVQPADGPDRQDTKTPPSSVEAGAASVDDGRSSIISCGRCQTARAFCGVGDRAVQLHDMMPYVSQDWCREAGSQITISRTSGDAVKGVVVKAGWIEHGGRRYVVGQQLWAPPDGARHCGGVGCLGTGDRVILLHDAGPVVL